MSTDTLRRPASAHAAPSPLHAFARFVALCCLVLLVAGGLVTSTGSSLAVPDWPLSFGKLMPPMLGGVAFEHGHRMIAGAVGLLIWALAAWVAKTEPRALVRVPAFAAAGAVVVQALLGGATVLLRLPPAVSIAHACLAQTVFCLLVAVVEATAPAPEGSLGETWKTGRLALGALFAQLAFGALLRHTGTGFWLHALFAAVPFALVLLVSTRGARLRPLADVSAFLSVLALTQPLLGLAAYKARYAVDFAAGFSKTAVLTTAHLAVGALLLGGVSAWTMRAYRAR